MKALLKRPETYAVIGFFQAIAALVGSLYFQYIEEYIPCDLCWYQRIALYPAVVFFAVALIKKEWNITRFALPLLLFGLVVSVYQNIVYYNANFWNPSAEVLPCSTSGISCAERYIEFAGFISIPFLALIGTLVMIGVVLAMRHFDAKK